MWLIQWNRRGFIVVLDCILRFGWVLRFYHGLFPSADSFTLATQFLEVFRRALWNLLRVEWEHIKQQKWKRQAAVSLQTHSKLSKDSNHIETELVPVVTSQKIPSRSASDEEMTGLLTHRRDDSATANIKST